MEGLLCASVIPVWNDPQTAILIYPCFILLHYLFGKFELTGFKKSDLFVLVRSTYFI